MLTPSDTATLDRGYEWGRTRYQEWKTERYTREHVQMKQKTLEKFKNIRTTAEAAQLCSDPVFNKLTEGEKQEIFGVMWRNGFHGCFRYPADQSGEFTFEVCDHPKHEYSFGQAPNTDSKSLHVGDPIPEGATIGLESDNK